MTTPSPARTLLAMAGASRPQPDPARATLVVIDAQRDYLDGALPLDGIEAAAARIADLRERAARLGVPVVHVRHEAPGGVLLVKDSPGAAFLPGLEPRPGEAVVAKRLPNSFAGTDLLPILRASGRDQLLLTGFMTHMCLDSTARAALDHGFTGLIPADATADRPLPDGEGGTIPASEVRRASLAALADRFAWVFPTAGEVAGAMEAGAAGR